jgi:hypothetical protein
MIPSSMYYSYKVPFNIPYSFPWNSPYLGLALCVNTAISLSFKCRYMHVKFIFFDVYYNDETNKIIAMVTVLYLKKEFY